MWKKLDLESKHIIDEYTKGKFFINDFTFTNLYLWSVGENIEYCLKDEILVIRGYYAGKKYYYMPLAKDESEESIQKIVDIISLVKKSNSPMGYFDEKHYLKLRDYFDFTEAFDYFDYIYNVQDLAFLKGRKYSKKRNRINVFERSYNYEYEKINADNIEEVKEFQKIWSAKNLNDDVEVLENELKGIMSILDNFEKLDIVGGLVRVDGKVVAYSIGEKLNEDMALIHIEKAFIDYVGSYQIINSLFLQNEFQNFKYVNREDDFGDTGLREAKMSYYPAFMLKKYNLT